MDGLLAILRPFLIVFQSYQDDGRVIMKGCNGTLFTVGKISICTGSRIRDHKISRLALSLLSYRGLCF